MQQFFRRKHNALLLELLQNDAVILKVLADHTALLTDIQKKVSAAVTPEQQELLDKALSMVNANDQTIQDATKK